MALTKWDKEHLTGAQQQGILAATESWESAKAAGDRAGMDSAHAAAEAIRNNANYRSDAAGNFSSVIPTARETYSPPSYDRYEKAVRRASGMNYDDWTKGDSYRRLAERYAANGRRAMDDTIGKLAAKTDGLASSYAASASSQSYDRYMEDLGDAARKQYAQERSDALGVANLEKSLADASFSRYDRAVNLARQDEKNARSEARKAIERILGSGGSLSDLTADLIRASGMTSAELQAIIRQAAAV